MDRQIDKLRKRRDFLAAAHGRKRAERGLVLQALDRHDSGAPRGAASPSPARSEMPSPATVPSARLRAAAAEILPLAAKPGYDYVLIGRHSTPTRRWAELLADLTATLNEVHGRRGRASTSSSDISRSDTGKDAPHG